MVGLNAIPTTEMKEDYYASKLDYAACSKLLFIAEIALEAAQHDGVALNHAKKTVMHLQERVTGNQKIMTIIETEMTKCNCCLSIDNTHNCR